MFNIRKLYIQNFKGVYRKTVLEIDKKSLTILNGPNGFGKTTVFDVIELCLRGHLERTQTYNYVTKKNSDHEKPFYQNRRSEDVILKLWVEEGENTHVIFKRLDKNNDGRSNGSRAFRPDAWNLLETYYSQDVSAFDEEPDYSTLRLVDQTFIDELFFGRSQLSMTKLYPLFNYLQQEDNIYFLKKDEEDKKEELNFLFQTQNEAFQLEQVTSFHKNIKAIRDAVKMRIGEIGQATGTSEDTRYQQIFLQRNFKFDAIEPFDSVSAEDLNVISGSYNTELQKLIDLSKTFDTSEYEKYKLRSQLRYAIDNIWFITSLALQNFCKHNAYDEFRTRVDRNNQLKTFRDRLFEYRFDEEILRSLALGDEFNNAFSNSIERRNRINSQMGEIGKIIQELNQARSATIGMFHGLHSLQPQDSSCPLCNASWPGMQELDDTINAKTRSLNSYNQGQFAELNELDQSIRNNYFLAIAQAIEDILTLPENAIDPEFFVEVIERRGNLPAVERFMSVLDSNQIDIRELILQTHVSKARLDENAAEIRSRLLQIANNLQIDETRIGSSEIIKEYYNDNVFAIVNEDVLQLKLQYIQGKYHSAKLFSVNILNQRLLTLNALERRLLDIKNKLSAAIKEYKKKMIEKIKIPFYIYSGKIIQHYQQGYGIFVDVNDNTSRVRFKTDESTDHDIIHQLSSGQLAVVSIAFCLSLNKVYQAPRHFKFLAIDDPVQTLDDLNIHSFIELLRHEFSDYQLIVSTHEENIANYLDYKFEKFQRSRAMINVQDVFYSNQLIE